jgi:hypothetical protein
MLHNKQYNNIQFPIPPPSTQKLKLGTKPRNQHNKVDDIHMQKKKLQNYSKTENYKCYSSHIMQYRINFSPQIDK